MDSYARAVQSGTAQQEGWPEWINIPSKIGQVTALRVLAREMHEQARQRDILSERGLPGSGRYGSLATLVHQYDGGAEPG